MNLNDIPLVGWIAAAPKSSGSMPIQLPPGIDEVDVKVECWAQKEEEAPLVHVTWRFVPSYHERFGPVVEFNYANGNGSMAPIDYRITILN